MRYICTSIVATLAIAGTSFAATIHVPGDHATIQGAINASSNGDVIAIAAGTYNEHSLNTAGKAITIGSASGNLDVTIDANGGGSCVLIESGEGDDTVIKDLVITGGNGTDLGGYTVGGGIACDNSSPTITGCTIEDNTGYYGGGIACGNSNPTITGCTITGNTASYYGGGIYCGNSNPTISGGSVCGNSPDQTFANKNSNIASGLCWIAESCDGNPYIVIANQQEQINQLLTMHDQQQSQIDTQNSAIEELQQVIEACCVERTCTGDENKDGVVNIEDLLIVISVWGPCP